MKAFENLTARSMAVVIFSFLLAGCIETTIRKRAAPTPAPTPPMRVEANIRLEDFQKLCNFLPEEGDLRNESGTDGAGKIVQITLGNGKRRQGASAARMGCTPGKTFMFAGSDLRLSQ